MKRYRLALLASGICAAAAMAAVIIVVAIPLESAINRATTWIALCGSFVAAGLFALFLHLHQKSGAWIMNDDEKRMKRWINGAWEYRSMTDDERREKDWWYAIK